jgi:hypothetical protein
MNKKGGENMEKLTAASLSSPKEGNETPNLTTASSHKEKALKSYWRTHKL